MKDKRTLEVGRSRKKEDWNRLDASTIEFLERVREGYLALARGEPDRWFVVDAIQSLDTVKEQVWARVSELFV